MLARLPTGHATLAPMSQAPASPGTILDEETVRRLLPPFRVILHNDDHNSMDHVVRSLLSAVPSLTIEDAAEIMLTAHNHGQATVIECPKEAAEHYRNRLETFGLTATIEPA
jgi:ATP-dependent Clp protease adaptor protein ClpS